MNTGMMIQQEKMNLVMKLTTAVRQPICKLSEYYSQVLDRRINFHQTLHLLHAQVAFVATVFGDSNLIVRMLCLAWFVAALLKCKQCLEE